MFLRETVKFAFIDFIAQVNTHPAYLHFNLAEVLSAHLFLYYFPSQRKYDESRGSVSARRSSRRRPQIGSS